MDGILRIANWTEHFENNRTRGLRSMNWVPLPNKHDGDGYTELLDHPDGAAHFAAWVAIVQVASKCDDRGTLTRAPGKPHDPASLARITRIPAEVFAAAIPRLVEIGWLEHIPSAGQQVTEIRQEGAAAPHESAGAPHQGAVAPHPPDVTVPESDYGMEGNGREQKGREENGTEGNGKESPEDVAGATSRRSKPDVTADVDAVLDHYRTYHPKVRPKGGGKERAAIRARLNEGWSVADLCKAIDGNHRSPWHCGENPGGTRYHGLTLIFRDSTHVQQFLEIPEHPPPVLSEKTQRTQRAGQSFLERFGDETEPEVCDPDDSDGGDIPF